MRVGSDIGGTFTDLVAVSADGGELLFGKALNGAGGPAEGLLAALRAASVEPEAVTELSHGTTTVTNLLIERTGATVGLVTTRGFRDVLEIQLSFRERTFDGRYRKTPAMVPRELRREVGGRVDAHGVEIEPLDLGEVERVLTELRDNGVECLAIALYNAYTNPSHERAVAEAWARVAPGLPASCATEVDPRMGEYERTSTAVLNAAAMPRMRDYVAELQATVAAPTLYMHSAGGVLLADDAAAHPIELAFSGPAGGVLAGRRVGRELGLPDVITLDMGGTSCDVCLIRGGEVRERESFDVAWGVPARVRSLDINTVGAGGGSIAWQDSGGALQVGPRSAGANPGPACYGRGGTQPTVTDANLVLGVIPPGGLLGGKLSLDYAAATAALALLGEHFGVGAVEMAQAIHSMVNANMAAAVREITVRHGFDPRDCAIVAFGGAGPQHAAGVARELGVTTVVVPAHAGVLSALGLLTADVRVSATRTLLDDAWSLDGAEVSAVFDELAADVRARLGAHDHDVSIVERWAGLRYRNQWHDLAVRVDAPAAELVARFEEEHLQRFGTRLGVPVEVVDVWLTIVAEREDPPTAAEPPGPPAPEYERELHLAGATVAVRDPRTLSADPVSGPCLVEEGNTVTVVPSDAQVSRRAGHVVIEVAA
jgi:N-methylhydantoinase A